MHNSTLNSTNPASPSPLTPSRGSENKAKIIEIYSEIASLLGANIDKDVIELAMKLLSASSIPTEGEMSVNSEALAALIVELQNETKKLVE